MKAPALLILLLFPVLALAQQTYYGTIATSVNLPLPADPGDQSVLKIHSGDVITPENIRSSIQDLYKTGHYRKIDVDATGSPAGTVISFIVTVQYNFSTFRLEPAGLLDRPITSYFPPPLGKIFSTPPVDRLVTDTKKLLQDSGYFNAMITPEISYDDRDMRRLATVILKASTTMKRAKIGTIQFMGGQPILTETELHSALKVSKGDDYNADKLDKGVAHLRQKFVEKGYLTTKVDVSDVAENYDAVMNTVNLTVTIEPGKTTIVQVSETGGTKADISDAKLRTLVPFFEEGAVDTDLEQEGRLNIETYYKSEGYFDAAVSTATNETADQAVEVKYTVDKGERHRVRSIKIEANTFFSEAEILKKMKTSEGTAASHGLFSPELLEKDESIITAMYRNAGFLSTLVTPRYLDTDSNIDITIHVVEGQRSVLDSITFNGNSAYTEPELWREAGIQSDQVYSAAIIDNARDALASFYYKNGYSEVRVESVLDLHPVDLLVDVRFDITEGPKYRIGKLYVSGNTLTVEPVITKASGLKEYDPYNPTKILEAQQNLYAMGIFNRVEVVALERDLGPDKVILIQVEEAKPILLTPGFGVTDRDGLRATIELSDINWLGRAKTISARVRGGRNERQFQASYREPRLFNHNLEGIASLSFDKTTHNDAQGILLFHSNESDFSIRTVRKLSRLRTLSFSASYETVNLQDIRLNPNIRQFPTTPGLIQIARLGTSFIEDKRDSVSDPTRGTFLTTTFEIANKHLGSEVNFASLYAQDSYFRPFRGGVIASSLRVGWKPPYGGDVDLPISERYFAGGSTTLRGFKFDAAGPQGGGQLLTIGNVEYRVPLNFLPIKGLGTALFYDTGNVFERPSDFAFTEFTHSIGTGIRYKTPIGPVRVDVGFNLRPKPGVPAVSPEIPAIPADRRYVFFFTLGHAF